MKVTSRFFAMCRDVTHTDAIGIDLPEGSTVAAFWELIIEKYPGLAKFRAQSRVAVNMDYVDETRILEEGDEVIIVPPVSGG